jgi:hypothetical protein
MEVSQHQKLTINKMDLEELRTLNSAVVQRIKWLRSEEAARMKRRLCFGCEVQFEDNDGKMITGYVLKTMRKYAQVEVGKQTWRVPMHRLTRTSTRLGA